MKKKIINIRVAFIIFVGLMLGILFCNSILLKNISLFAKFFLPTILLLICVGVIIYACITKKENLKNKYRKNMSTLLIISSVGFVVAFILGTVLMLMPMYSIFKLKSYSTEVVVQGTVCDYVTDASTYTKFIIKDVTIDDEGQTHCDSKICVYTDVSAGISLGDKIEFSGNLEKYNIFLSSEASVLYQKIGYNTYVNSSKISILSNNPSLKDKIKESTKDLLEDNLNSDNAEISYAILFGEKQGLNQNIKDMFSYSGISHILAVSGLHIGVLVSILLFIFSKTKLNKWVNFCLLGFILLFYSYLCSFTPSVCRASIMAMVLSLCKNLKIEYDSLSSLSIAGIIILLISPLSLFSVSFQLSFLCIFSIISLAPTISDFLTKIKLPKFLASTLSISVATNIAILPICYNVFSKVSVLGIITNIFVLPVFSVAYIMLFVITFLSLILKFLGVLLFLPNLLLHLIKVVANAVSNIPFGIFKVFNISYWSLVLIILASIILHFLMVKKIFKSCVVIVLTSIVLSIFMSNAIPKSYSGYNYIVCQKHDSNCVYVCQDDEVTLVGSNIDKSIILKELKELRIKKITNIVAYDLQLNSLNNLQEIIRDNYVEMVYLPSKYNYDEVIEKLGNVEFFDDVLNINKMSIETLNFGDDTIAICIDSKIGKMLIPELKPTKSEAEYIIKNFRMVDIVYLNNADTNLDVSQIKTEKVILNNGSMTGNFEVISDFGNLVLQG